MPLVCHCQKDCTDEEIREALLSLGVPEEHLGRFGTPAYEQRRQLRAASGERGLLEQARRELADLRSVLADLLGEQLTPAMLRIRILAAIEEIAVPSERKEFLALATRAGVGRSQRYEAWTQVCATQGQPVVATEADHVVLAAEAEDCQVAQRNPHVRFPETGRATADRPETGREAGSQPSGNRTTDEADMTEAIRTLQRAGLKGKTA
jgi:hypothetical protein